jgi:hypothetical protein
MRLARSAIAVVCGAIALAALGADNQARAELDLGLTPAPCSVLSGHPCHPSFCSVFHRGPCFPEYRPPIGQDFGQDLRLTMAATEGTSKDKPVADRRDDGQLVDSIRDMFDALRACWVPPPKEKAHHGMEYTVRFAFKRNGELMAPAQVTYTTHDVPVEVRDIYRDAVEAALKRCTPMHFSNGMASAIPGRPISMRFIDDRMIGDDSGKGDSGK